MAMLVITNDGPKNIHMIPNDGYPLTDVSEHGGTQYCRWGSYYHIKT